jgi:hypothetical protein
VTQLANSGQKGARTKASRICERCDEFSEFPTRHHLLSTHSISNLSTSCRRPHHLSRFRLGLHHHRPGCRHEGRPKRSLWIRRHGRRLHPGLRELGSLPRMEGEGGRGEGRRVRQRRHARVQGRSSTFQRSRQVDLRTPFTEWEEKVCQEISREGAKGAQSEGMRSSVLAAMLDEHPADNPAGDDH